MSTKPLDLRPLKKFVIEHLPVDSSLRDVILTDDDLVTPPEYLMRLRIWLKLLRLELVRVRR
jgi:hypothetical protein